MIAPTLVAAGVGTLFYLILTKFKSPMFLASSFAYISPMMAALAIGSTVVTSSEGVVLGNCPNLWILPIGMAMVGIVYCIVALFIKIFGVGWLNKLLPPIVVGPVIMVIGLSLASSAISNLNGTSSGDYNLIKILCGLSAMVATALSAHYGKGTVSLIPFVIGMAVGYLVALIFTLIGYTWLGNSYFEIIDFSPIIKNFSPVTFTSFFDYPRFLFLLNDSSVPLTWSAVGQAALLFIPVSFVTICEHVGDHKNMSGILGKDLLTDPGLSKTLAGDGIATALSGVMCGAANTTYGENVAVVGVTKIASTKVIVLACFMAIALGFISPLMSFTETIPACVTGGVSLILYGFIAASGVKMLINEHIDMGKTKNIFVASVILVSGIGGLTLSFGNSGGSPIVEITSVAVSMILGVIMNLILKDKKEDVKKEAPAVEAKKDSPVVETK
jgi:uracil permease